MLAERMDLEDAISSKLEGLQRRFNEKLKECEEEERCFAAERGQWSEEKMEILESNKALQKKSQVSRNYTLITFMFTSGQKMIVLIVLRNKSSEKNHCSKSFFVHANKDELCI